MTRYLLIALSLASLAACGSSGGGVTTPPPMAPQPMPQPTPQPTPPPAPPPPNFNTVEFQTNAGLAQINALPAYDAGLDGDGVTVAIIDTGIDVDNPEFAGRISPASADLVTAPFVGFSNARIGGADLNDIEGHGTSVASIIGAARDSVGVHGVAPEANLLVFRANDNVDQLVILGGAIDEAIRRTVNQGAGVLNLSLGSNQSGARTDFQNIFSRTSQGDVVTVIAAGNEGLPSPEESALAAIDPEARGAVIIAGSVDGQNNITSFTNRAGIAASRYLVAPGVFIPTVELEGGAGDTINFSGTSASTPFIAGAAALIREQWPTLSAADVVDILLDTATGIGPATTFGQGLINIGAALQPQGGATTSSVAQSFSVDPITPAIGASPVFGASAPDLGSFAFLDAYGRDFVGSLSGLSAMDADYRIGAAAALQPFNEIRIAGGALGNGSAAVRFTANALNFTDPEAALRAPVDAVGWAGDADPSIRDERVDFAFTQRLTPAIKQTTAYGFSPRETDAISSRSQLTARAGLSRDGLADGFLSQSPDALSTAVEYRLGKIAVQAFAAEAFDVGETNFRLAATRQWGDALLRVESGAKSERGAILGARVGGVFGDGVETTTLYGAMVGGLNLSPRLRLDGRFAFGATSVADAGGLLNGVDDLQTMQAALAMTAFSAFRPGDQFSLTASHPLQAVSGDLLLTAPIAFDFSTDEFLFENRAVALAPTIRAIDIEAAYAVSGFLGGVLEFNLLGQMNAGPNGEAGATARLRHSFSF
ncbi:MAG: S8 family peptidase [Pseudomonadota bacterium]